MAQLAQGVVQPVLGRVHKLTLASRMLRKHPGVSIGSLTGASAVGKDMLINRVISADPNCGKMVSCTTRERRPDDRPGDYRYLTEDEFQDFVDSGAFLWYTGNHGARYGTQVSEVESALGQKFPTFLHLDPPSTPKLRARSSHAILSFFVHAQVDGEDPEVTKARLRKRMCSRSELSSEKIERRLNECINWYEEARRGDIPYIFIDNSRDDNGEYAYQQFLEALVG